MLCYSNWLEHCVIYNDWFIGSLYSPFKIAPFATKGKYNLTFHSVRFACFSSWNDTLCDICQSPIAMPHYPRSHWFESFLEPHNSFWLFLGSATSKTFVFNLPLIPLKKKNGISFYFSFLVEQAECQHSLRTIGYSQEISQIHTTESPAVSSNASSMLEVKNVQWFPLDYLQNHSPLPLRGPSLG